MSKATVEFIAPGLTADQQEIDELAALIHQLLALPAFVGKHPSMVLNALVSAYWTAASAAGMQAIAAQGMVQIGGSYLAKLALAQRAAGGDPFGNPPVVH